MTRVRASKRRDQNYRSVHTAIVLVWRDGHRAHRPEREMFDDCSARIKAADVTSTDRARLHAALWSMREYSVLTHARWQLYLDGNPVRSEDISRAREAGDKGAWQRVAGRHEYDESNDPYYDRDAPHLLNTK